MDEILASFKDNFESYYESIPELSIGSDRLFGFVDYDFQFFIDYDNEVFIDYYE